MEVACLWNYYYDLLCLLQTKGGNRKSYSDWIRKVMARQTREHKHEKMDSKDFPDSSVWLWDVDNDKENGKKDQRMWDVDMEEDAKNIMDGEED